MNEEADIETQEIKSAPPPTRQTRRRRARGTRVDVKDSELAELRKQNEEFRRRLEAIEVGSAAALSAIGGPNVHIPQPGPPSPTISFSDVQAAKAIIAQAENALGIVKPKGEAPIPTHPPKLEDPLQGDKTPAVVEWYRDNDPKEYERRYAGRRTHLEDRRGERRVSLLPAGVTPAPFPDDPDGIVLSKTDDSGRAPQVLS